MSILPACCLLQRDNDRKDGKDGLRIGGGGEMESDGERWGEGERGEEKETESRVTGQAGGDKKRMDFLAALVAVGSARIWWKW